MPASNAHSYLVRKQVHAYGLRQYQRTLLVPLCDEKGHLWSLQFIHEDGTKRFLKGGRTRGMFHMIGKAFGSVVCIAEGYATAASVHEATGYPVAVAFSAGNLQAVAMSMRRRFGDVALVICADDDAETAARTGTNPGLAAAKLAAHMAGGTVAMPPRANADKTSALCGSLAPAPGQPAARCGGEP
jgi:putative DNA primase/helicase